MQLFSIRRRSGWADTDEIGAADDRARAEAERLSEKLRHVRTYLLEEEDGRLGTLCFYEAENANVVREHARCAKIPADEIVPVGATMISVSDVELEGAPA